MRSAGVLRLAFAMAFAVSLGHAAEPMHRFDVSQPFRVGSHTYAAGTISLHVLRDYNPTTSLLEVYVNGTCIGLIAARRDVSDVRSTRTEALFQRDDEGVLVMTGYRTTDRSAGTTFRFHDAAIAQGGPAPTASLIGSY